MIYPKIFEMVSSDLDVRAVFGTNPVRVFPFGYAPQDIDKLGTYAVFQTISGIPNNTLACPPTIDDWTVQIDVYAKNAQLARTGASALIMVLQNEAYITSIRGETRDFETKRYRYSFDIQLLQYR